MNTIKDYYIEIQSLYARAVKMLTALNSSLTSQSAQVPLTLIDDDSSETVVNIPSFLYLENKLARFQESFESIVKSPATGEAWITATDKPAKLSLVDAAAAPAPVRVSGGAFASARPNTFFKDLVFPRLTLGMELSGLSPDVHQIAFAKLVFSDGALWQAAKSRGGSLGDVKALLEGSDGWNAYESLAELPLRDRDSLVKFEIIEALDSPDAFGSVGGRPYVDVRLAPVQYADSADPSRVRRLAPGVELRADRGYAKITLAEVPYDAAPDAFRLIVTSGRLDINRLQDGGTSWSETFDTYLTETSETWGSERRADIPLEEDRYVAVSLAPVRNGIRGRWSDPVFFDLEAVPMTDGEGNIMKSADGRTLSYMDYYRQYAANAGDAVTSLALQSYPGADTVTPALLTDMQSSKAYAPSIDPSAITVAPINNHLSDATAIDELKSLHRQKQEIESQLASARREIDTLIESMRNTEGDARANLSSQLRNAYSERARLEKQSAALVNEITSKANSAVLPRSAVKYRVRGHIALGDYEARLAADGLALAGLDIQYKYKSLSKDTTVAAALQGAVFTSWNRYAVPMKDRSARYENGTLRLSESLELPETDSIKWNQIDLPIQQGEDVVVRVRGIYTAGQPFFNIYSPWSDETVFSFPENYELNADVQDIVEVNKNDAVNAAFTARLLEDGYEEHVSDKVVENDATYLHQPESIASGFYTQEHKIIPLRDKLYDIEDTLQSINAHIDNMRKLDYTVSAETEGKSAVMYPGVAANVILPTYLEHYESASAGAFVEEIVTVRVSNNGASPLRLYSIFPGDSSKALSRVRTELYGLETGNYDIFPLHADGDWRPQTMGQWIYFRNTNPFTKEYDNFSVTDMDKRNFSRAAAGNEQKSAESLLRGPKQMPLRYVPHEYSDSPTPFWGTLTCGAEIKTELVQSSASQDASVFSENYRPGNFAGRYDGNRYGEGKGNDGFGFDKKTPLGNQPGGPYTGAMAFPVFESSTNILAAQGANELYREVKPGSSVAFPVKFQYYLTPSTPEVSKTLYFDIRPNLFSSMEHYILKINAKYADAANSAVAEPYYDEI